MLLLPEDELLHTFFLVISILDWVALDTCFWWLKMPVDVTVCRSCAWAMADFSALNVSLDTFILVAATVFDSCCFASPDWMERASCE